MIDKNTITTVTDSPAVTCIEREGASMDASKIISSITEHTHNDQYQELHWTGSYKSI